MTHRHEPDLRRRFSTLPLLLCLILVTTAAHAGQRFHYLAKALAFDGIVPEDVAPQIAPALLDELEADAEEAYFKNAAIGTERSIIVSLHTDRERRAQVLTEKSGAGRTALQADVRASQDRVLQSMVATKSQQGSFRWRNRYTTLAGFSAYADLHGIAALAKHPDVAYVEEMQVFETQSLDSEADALTQVSLVHGNGDFGAGTTIAIIDSGLDYSHPLLSAHPRSVLPTDKVLGGYDFGDNDSDPMIDCPGDSHGTAVASIAAGRYSGIAPGANLVHLKVQSAASCDDSAIDGDVPGAIDWVVTNQATYGIDIISMSLGSGSFTSVCDANSPGLTSPYKTAYRLALDDADAAGIMVFAASGNEATKDALGFPACYATVNSVGAVYDKHYRSKSRSDGNGGTLCTDTFTRPGEVTCYSNSADFLDFLAPANCATALRPNGGITGCFTGTSSATPYAAGVAALLMDRNPTLSKDQIKNYMTQFGTPTTDPDNGVRTPLVNAWVSWLFTPPGS